MNFFSLTPLEAKEEIEKTSIEAKAIEVDASLSDNHPAIEEGVTCADCHEIKLDANTTATQVWLTGNYAGFNPNEGLVSNEKVKEAIVKVMGGRKRPSNLCACNLPQ